MMSVSHEWLLARKSICKLVTQKCLPSKLAGRCPVRQHEWPDSQTNRPFDWSNLMNCNQFKRSSPSSRRLDFEPAGSCSSLAVRVAPINADWISCSSRSLPFGRFNLRPSLARDSPTIMHTNKHNTARFRLLVSAYLWPVSMGNILGRRKMCVTDATGGRKVALEFPLH